MIENSYIKCQKCTTFNKNSDYCINCGEIINIVLKRHLEAKKRQVQKKVPEKFKGPNKIEQLQKQAAEHPNIMVRWICRSIHILWTFLAMVIAVLIAMVIATAAG